MDTLLQLFLLLNVFLMGALTMLALQHAYAHFRPHRLETHQPSKPAASIPQVVKRRLMKKAEENYQTILDRSAAELQRTLSSTTLQLNKQLDSLSRDIVQDETKQYQEALKELRTQAATAISSAQQEASGSATKFQQQLEQRQKEIDEKLAAEYEKKRTELQDRLAQEEERQLQLLDTKLADAIASFLTETMQHEIDLGAQTPYLIAQLEEHKDDLRKAIGGSA